MSHVTFVMRLESPYTCTTLNFRDVARLSQDMTTAVMHAVPEKTFFSPGALVKLKASVTSSVASGLLPARV